MSQLSSQYINADEASINRASSAMSFPELDLDNMKESLRLEEIGGENGVVCKPRTDSDTYDNIEQKIVSEIQTIAEDNKNQFSSKISEYNNQIKALGYHALSSGISGVSKAAQSDFKACVLNGSNHLYGLTRSIINLEAQLDDFKSKNDLVHEPLYPASRIFYIGLLLFLVAFEGVLNGTFLAEGDILGLSGGVGKAIAIALVNVLMGVMVGLWVITEMVHKSVVRKFIGFMGMLAYIGAIIVFNLMVAHYRNALGGPDPELANFTAWQSFVENPLGLEDVKSWFLFIVGMVFSIGSCIDGWFMDEPYPGYGRIDRRYKEIAHDFTEMKELLLDDLSDIRNEALLKINRSRSDIDSRKTELDSIQSSKSIMIRKRNKYHDYLQRCGNDLLRFYRTANQEQRPKKCPPPSRFKESWGIDADMDVSDKKNFDGSISSAFEEILAQQKLLHSSYDAAVQDFKRVSHLNDGAMPANDDEAPDEDDASEDNIDRVAKEIEQALAPSMETANKTNDLRMAAAEIEIAVAEHKLGTSADITDDAIEAAAVGLSGQEEALPISDVDPAAHMVVDPSLHEELSVMPAGEHTMDSGHPWLTEAEWQKVYTLHMVVGFGVELADYSEDMHQKQSEAIAYNMPLIFEAFGDNIVVALVNEYIQRNPSRLAQAMPGIKSDLTRGQADWDFEAVAYMIIERVEDVMDIIETIYGDELTAGYGDFLYATAKMVAEAGVGRAEGGGPDLSESEKEFLFDLGLIIPGRNVESDILLEKLEKKETSLEGEHL